MEEKMNKTKRRKRRDEFSTILRANLEFIKKKNSTMGFFILLNRS